MKTGISSLAAPFAIAAMLTSSAMAAGSDLKIFDWSGYEDPGFYAGYLEKYGEAPSYSYFANEEEAFAKLRAGYESDLAHPCSYTTGKWKDAGMLKPIDTGKLRNWDSLIEGIRGLEGIAHDGVTYMVPFDWGNTGLIYRTDVIDPANVSLELLTDPAYEGKIAMPAGALEALPLAVLATGSKDSFPDLSDEQFDKALDYLREVHKNVRFYWSDASQLGQALASGEAVMGWGWNQTELELMGAGIPATMMRDTEKGLVTWVCGYVHLDSATAPDEQVYDMLNALTDAKSGTYIVDAWGYAHSNANAYADANQDMVKAFGYDNPQKFFEGSLFGLPIRPELEQRLTEEYERIKAGF